MAAPTPIRDVLLEIGRAICLEIVRLLNATGRQPLSKNSALAKQLLSGEAMQVLQGRDGGGRFTASGSLQLFAFDYLQWVDGGRRKGAKKVPLDALIKFIKQRNIGQARGKGGKYGKRSDNITRLAFIIQAAIYRNGIKPRPVIAPAFALGEALLQDFLDNRMLDNLTADIEKQLSYIDTKK
jgi:hypothetical protein